MAADEQAKGSSTESGGWLQRSLARFPPEILEILLKDRTTGKNIVWADDEYQAYGDGFQAYDEITIEKITGDYAELIKPRVAKELETQSLRTRSHAEVFTPSWLCRQMNDYLDEDYFRRPDVFFDSNGQMTRDTVEFTSGDQWLDYICQRRLEITCGEAPFICARADAATGEDIPVENRSGFLDRKLRVVTENTNCFDGWYGGALNALKSTFGYERQGDNLIIARINVLTAVAECMEHCWQRWPIAEQAMELAEVVSWNIWQMDGITLCVPSDLPADDGAGSLFDLVEEFREEKAPRCLLKNWDNTDVVAFADLNDERSCAMSKFYAAIGNPPYQEEVDGNGRSAPLYPYFMDSAFSIAERSEFITPARFLFNAGQTQKAWNKKMLGDSHFSVLHYDPDSTKVFPTVDIKGGVAITYFDTNREVQPIGVFIPDDTLRAISEKVATAPESSLMSITVGAVPYSFTEVVKRELPEVASRISSSFDLRTNVLNEFADCLFFEDAPSAEGYSRILGVECGHRVFRWIKTSYLGWPDNFTAYKVALPEANNNGVFGEMLANPLVLPPMVGHTQTFISMGCFATEQEADALLRYLKTKFARTLLGILKKTQHNPKSVWAYVPIQDFSSNSDIDWTVDVQAIDQQLYSKYGLSQLEIDFIESHVKEMQ